MKARLFYGVYGLLALANPQVLTDSFAAHVYSFQPGASTALTYNTHG